MMTFLKKILVAAFLIFLSAPLFSESEVATTLETYYGVRHLQENTAANQKDENADQGGAKVNVRMTPLFQPQEGFQSDYLIDLNVMKRFESKTVDVDLNQSYLDFLFHDSVGLQMGLAVIDYGSNSYFHPLQVAEIVPDIKQRYGRQFFGTTDLGYHGVPSLRGKWRLPSFNDDLYITVRQTEIFLNVDLSSANGNVTLNSSQSVKEPKVMDKKAYSITDMSFIYKNFDLDLLGGYIDQKKPVWGMAVSYLFPFQIVGYAEALYRGESFRTRIENGTYSEYEKGKFVNASVGASVSFTDPVLRNPVQLGAELFYYGEGFDGKQFSDVRHFLSYKNNYTYYPSLIQYERNFIRNGMIRISYTFPEYRFSVTDQIVGSEYTTLQGGYRYLAGNQLLFTKSYDQVQITLAYYYNSSMARDNFVFQGNDKSVFLDASVIF